MMEFVGQHIDGRERQDGERDLPIVDPARSETVRRVALAGADQVDAAIAAAGRAFESWRNVPPHRRAAILLRYKLLLEARASQVAALITQEHGKVLDDAMGEVARGIEIVDYACGIANLLKGEHTPNVGPAIDSWSEFQPLGIVAGITPFNFPAMVPLWMFPIAIACGNCFILKPSERTPSAAMLLAKLFGEAGLPPGVLNVVNGDKAVVDRLLASPEIEAVSFVGSTAVAEYIYATGASYGKRVQALGGAKNHAVIMPDADIDNSVNALMGAAYGSCGERCMAISVAVCVGNEVADRIVAGLAEQIASLKVGPGTDTGNQMGPLITMAHRDRVRGYVDLGIDEGAELVCDGRSLADKDGAYLGACLFDRVTPDMRIYRDEIFGPVLCVVRAASLDEAITLVNAHEYGNGACIFTSDGEAARIFTDRVKIGMVGVNVPLPVPAATQSFGGWKRSLFGDLHIYGPDGVRFYTRRKTITQRWFAGGKGEKARFAFPSGAG